VAVERITTWGEGLVLSHPIPAVLPDDNQGKKPGNPPEQQLVAMLKAAGLGSFETERPIKLSGGVVTRPDVYFHAPNDQFDGVCVYLDGMSEHLHGNAKTAAQDRQIREELLNSDYEVVAIQYQELYDKTVMRTHMRRIAKAVLGKAKAKEVSSESGCRLPRTFNRLRLKPPRRRPRSTRFLSSIQVRQASSPTTPARQSAASRPLPACGALSRPI